MVYFFFYNHLVDENLIKILDYNSLISNAFTYVNLFDKKNNLLNISKIDEENIKILEGKLVFFPNYTLEEILNRLSFIDKIKYTDRTIYKLEKIHTYIKNSKEVYNAYIIY